MWDIIDRIVYKLSCKMQSSLKQSNITEFYSLSALNSGQIKKLNKFSDLEKAHYWIALVNRLSSWSSAINLTIDIWLNWSVGMIRFEQKLDIFKNKLHILNLFFNSSFTKATYLYFCLYNFYLILKSAMCHYFSYFLASSNNI